PTLPQSVVDDAMAQDLAAAKSEYLGEFRDDIAAFVPRSVVEAVVIKDRKELLPRQKLRYHGFVDVSGGRGDDACLAIAHREGRLVVLDKVSRLKAPFEPYFVVGKMCEELRQFGLRSVVGDAYGAEFVSQSFESNGVHYSRCEKPKA